MAVYDPDAVAKNPQGIYPNNAVAGQEWSRCEPLLTPQLFVQRFLFGIPLVSQVVNPLTKKPDVMTPDMLQDLIFRAVSTLETELQVSIFPVQHQEQVPYDRVFLQQWQYIRVKNKPVLSVDRLALHPQNNTRAEDILVFPPSWISITSMRGQINIIPLVSATDQSFSLVSTGNGAAFLLAFLGSASFTPSMYQITYTAGMPESAIPKFVNELVGITAALEALSMIAATFRISSYSLGLDGLSQSQSLPGPAIYKTRVEELLAKKKMLLARARTLFGTKVALGTL